LVQSLSFIFLELFDECVLHFSEEASIELVPLRRLQVALLQNCAFAEDIDVAPDVHVPAVDNLAVTLFLSRVDFFHVVLCILNYNFVRLIVQSVDDCDLVALSVLNPPAFEAEAFNVI
jgi:hypothetical protein